MKKLLVLLGILITANILTAQADSIIYEGLERTYRLFVPASGKNNAVPLVINLHGAGSNALEQEYYSEFDNVADTAGFMVVYPNAINGIWNIYSGGEPNDLGFISALIDTLSSEYTIDQRRIYATGMSLGGFMCYKLACQLSNKIAAIGSVAGLMIVSQCTPGRPFPVCQIHGTADSTVQYQFVSLTINFWTGLDECTDSTVVNLPDVDTTDQSTVTLTTYKPCNSNTEVLLYTINGGGHSWPGASYIIDVTNQDIHANVEIWKFFSQFMLPEGAGIEELPSPGLLSVYPNPVIDRASIVIPNAEPGEKILQLRDLSGKLIKEKCLNATDNISFSREGLAVGVYFITLKTKKSIYYGKFLVE